jgi:tetratricopeptide (TPR) repeat protein
MSRRSILHAARLSLFLLPLAALAAGAEKIPITTTSEEARQLYLQGRDANEKLRGTDAYALFALGYLGLTQTAPTNQAFFAALKKAVALADKVSEGERLEILGVQAGVLGDIEGQKRMYLELVAKFPGDERALNTLGNFFFGVQDYPSVIIYLTKATELAPNFSAPYNQLGYAYRFLGKYPEAEKTFKKYTELLPTDPNP